jgi:hypothetical protein
MIHRIKILVALIQELGLELEAKSMHSLLFLFCHEFIEHNHYYEFLAVRWSPFHSRDTRHWNIRRSKKPFMIAGAFLSAERKALSIFSATAHYLLAYFIYSFTPE